MDKKKYLEELRLLGEEVQQLEEKNCPTNPSKWSYYKSQAKQKFDVYPSAYANGWASKQYKAAGGGWKQCTGESVNEEQINEWKLQLDLGKVNPSEFENWASDSLQKKHKIKVSGSGRNWTIVGKGNDDRMGSSADWISQLLGKAWTGNKIKVVQKESVNEGKKRFRQKDGIGKAKYTISFHDGKQKHKDGSDFFGIQIFKNKKDLETFRKSLLSKGYVEESVNDPEELKIGNYQTKYFHVCPGASSLYKDIESKGVDVSMAERSAKLHDVLFFIEEHIQRPGYKVDPNYLLVAKNVASEIMKLAKMMGLEKEHNYIQGHIDIIQKVANGQSVNEAASRTAMEIGGLTGMNKDAIQKFVDDNNLDIEKVYQYVKKGKLPQRMELVSAITGRPNNPVQKKIIKMFGESIDEGMVAPRRGHNYYQLTKDTPIKYISGHSGIGLEVPGVLLHNEYDTIKGKKGAYIIDYFGQHFYVDMKNKFASAIANPKNREQNNDLMKNVERVSSAPEHSDWKKYMKESVNESFKKGDKITYLGHPGEITSVEDKYGKTYVSLYYNKGNGKTKVRGILSTDSSIKAETVEAYANSQNKKQGLGESKMNKSQLKELIREEYHNVKNFMEEKYGFTPELGKVIDNPYVSAFKVEDYLEEGGETDAEMAVDQMETMVKRAQELIDKLRGKSNLEPWVQSLITKAEDYISTVSDYGEVDEYDVENYQDVKEFAEFMESYKPSINEAEYQGRKVELGKIMQGDVKKFKVYVNNDKGNVVKVNFGQKGMTIKKDNPEARKSFRARMNCDSPGPRWKARYWSCRKW